MTFIGLSYLAVAIAAITGFIIGAIWYTLLGKPWLAAIGKAPEDVRPTPLPFVIAGIAQVVIAIMLAGIVGHLGAVTITTGVVSGLFVWIGFVATTMAVNHAFQGARLMLTVIDGGHWLAVFLAQGLMIGAVGV